ncbi:hypothetical protein FS749_010807 [Ceratobasidium sp. UAMH 11750]|nr:hypothetical protein FS749_010807 [Ceratobasidium sp. UAMH 11750]
MEIFAHSEEVEAYVVEVGKHDLVLGMSWLKKHNPLISWAKHTINFHSDYCAKNCLGATSKFPFDVNKGEEIALNAVLPDNLTPFHNVFAEEETTPLPPHHPYDIAIDLKLDAVPCHGPLYSIGLKEDEELRKTLDCQLENGLIRPSKSPMASPIIFIKKKNGKLRMVIDYCQLNIMTIKNVYPLPKMLDLITKLCGVTIFTKLDLKWGYNLVCIKEGDEWKTAFKTKYRLFKYLVMLFGLTNAPATFQHFMHDVFRDLLDIYVIVYLDNILIFSKSKMDHDTHVPEVLRHLRANHLYCKLEKCFFYVTEIDYLGLMVSPDSIKVDQEKVTKAVDWKNPHNVMGVQEFLGFVNFYCRFIPDYSAKAAPLFQLLKKDTTWSWTEDKQKSFDELKTALISTPLLAQLDLLR